ncbi:hypothetical protein [Pseudomonas juntendi]|uniref:hypothetical protein n=2 Tax=Pseudomonas TaxID=286 RepID=UPI001E563B8D|nr:hypothetical protein [Pseudomonas juntendi]
MRQRGEVFWAWADPNLQHRTHQELLDDGASLDVQVRLSRTGDTQLFIGIYESTGAMRYEEAYDKRPGETMSRAMVWATGRARVVAKEQRPAGEGRSTSGAHSVIHTKAGG